MMQKNFVMKMVCDFEKFEVFDKVKFLKIFMLQWKIFEKWASSNNNEDLIFLN